MKYKNAGKLPVKAPLAADGVAKELWISTGGLSVDLVVGTHDTGHLAFYNTGFEWYIVGVCQVLFAYLPTSKAQEISIPWPITKPVLSLGPHKKDGFFFVQVISNAILASPWKGMDKFLNNLHLFWFGLSLI